MHFAFALAVREWTQSMEETFEKRSLQCGKTCQTMCGDGDRNLLPDAKFMENFEWMFGEADWKKYFIRRCNHQCEQLSSTANDDGRGLKGCKARCHEANASANMCRIARSTNRNYETDNYEERKLFGLDWCRFEAEQALGPRYLQATNSTNWVYQPGEYPTTGIQRDDPFFPKLFKREKVGWDYAVQRPLDQWLYQDTQFFQSEYPAIPAGDAAKDWDLWMEKAGNACRERLLGEHSQAKIDSYEGRQEMLQWETCGDRCQWHCYNACRCHWDEAAKRALKEEGKSRLWTWDDTEFKCLQ